MKKKRPFSLSKFTNRIKQEINAEKQAVINVKVSNLIVNSVINHYRLLDHEIFEVTRKRHIVFARQVAMYFLKKHTHMGLSEIGRIFSGKDHATVLYAIKTVENLIDSDKKIKQDITVLKEELNFQLHILYKTKSDLNKKYYFIELDNFTSAKVDNEKAIIICGYSDEEIKDILNKLDLENIKPVKHENKKQYVIEINNDANTRDKTSLDS